MNFTKAGGILSLILAGCGPQPAPSPYSERCNGLHGTRVFKTNIRLDESSPYCRYESFDGANVVSASFRYSRPLADAHGIALNKIKFYFQLGDANCPNNPEAVLEHPDYVATVSVAGLFRQNKKDLVEFAYESPAVRGGCLVATFSSRECLPEQEEVIGLVKPFGCEYLE